MCLRPCFICWCLTTAQQRGFIPDNSGIDWFYKGGDNGNLSVWLLTLYLYSRACIPCPIDHTRSCYPVNLIILRLSDEIAITSAAQPSADKSSSIIPQWPHHCRYYTVLRSCAWLHTYAFPTHTEWWLWDGLWCVLLLIIYSSLSSSQTAHLHAKILTRTK